MAKAKQTDNQDAQPQQQQTDQQAGAVPTAGTTSFPGSTVTQESDIIPGTPEMIKRNDTDQAAIAQVANRSVQQDDQGRFVVRFPAEYQDVKLDIGDQVTFASRELAYQAAVKALQDSGRFKQGSQAA